MFEFLTTVAFILIAFILGVVAGVMYTLRAIISRGESGNTGHIALGDTLYSVRKLKAKVK